MRIPQIRCRYVRSVGVEVECGIPNQEGYRLVRNFEYSDSRFKFGTDGSVNVTGCYVSDAELRYWTFIPEEWGRFVTVLRWLWEEIEIRQNASCGNHIHIKMRDDWMQVLVHPEFVRYFQRKYLNFARKQSDSSKYIARIRSTYSSFYRWRNYQDLENQVLDSYQGSGSRYRSVNYWSLGESQGTLEFRIMPFAENFHEHLQMIRFIIRVVEEYCRKFQKGMFGLPCSEISALHGLSYQLDDRYYDASAVHFYISEQIELHEVEVNEPQLLEDITIEVTTL
jgi:hypothetical protein